MSKNFKDDDELLNSNDGMDIDEESNHEQDDWIARKKNYFSDDAGEIFSDEIEFWMLVGCAFCVEKSEKL